MKPGQEINNPPMTPAEILQLKKRFHKKIIIPDYSKEAWKLEVEANPQLLQSQIHILKQLKKPKTNNKCPKEHHKIPSGRLPKLLAAKKLIKQLMSYGKSTSERDSYKSKITQINREIETVKKENRQKHKTCKQ